MRNDSAAARRNVPSGDIRSIARLSIHRIVVWFKSEAVRRELVEGVVLGVGGGVGLHAASTAAMQARASPVFTV
ncbi:hypothetical protein [Mycobacteroides abscessus]|uniref:hypothetical protein n=1 Tax=Mycobacteroides abscessus TaxID=36809 RepID=UPI00130004D4|nr:hypothetical protein [Mycobacteroides abscessus]MDM1887975.1 hypothetical protein [Mycobacteroides abscessus]MDM1892859.1 hypothetical protein [Mycobacteroides abscessus]MDM2419330.1 hypothetical protein [Mycobacteroides abscessus]MDM2425872.1 hypothetical protein [Mycobacteroides abscessus]MDM2431529.1 hypothetical protein [Mycobacteroides abscessus]